MHSILNYNGISCFPITFYIHNQRDLKNTLVKLTKGKYLIKPDDESASIGVEIYDFSSEKINEFEDYLLNYSKKFPIFCLQEFICGKEVEVLLLCFQNGYYCPGPCEIINMNELEILTYDSVKVDNYEFAEYMDDLKTEVVEISKKVATILGFKTICRIDFRIHKNQFYIIDIGANPTISYHSSANYMCRKYLGCSSSIYQLLVYKALTDMNLFKPSIN